MKNDEFGIIYKRYYKDVYYYTRALTNDIHLAEEITQNTFYKAIKKADSFRGECDIRVWLCQIAKYDFLNYKRKQKRMVSGDDVNEMLSEIPDVHSVTPHQNVEDAELAQEICNILEKMDEPYKEVFSLRVLHELSYEKIAQLYGKSESWARVTFYRAKQKIIGEMGNKELGL